MQLCACFLCLPWWPHVGHVLTIPAGSHATLVAAAAGANALAAVIRTCSYATCQSTFPTLPPDIDPTFVNITPHHSTSSSSSHTWAIGDVSK